MSAGSVGELDSWHALPGDEVSSASETADYLNIVATLGGERGLVNSAESACIVVVNNALRLVTSYSEKHAAIGQLQWSEGVAATSFTIAARTQCRRTLVVAPDRSEDDEVSTVVTSRGTSDAVALQSTFVGYSKVIGAASAPKSVLQAEWLNLIAQTSVGSTCAVNHAYVWSGIMSNLAIWLDALSLQQSTNFVSQWARAPPEPVSYTHLRAHETEADL
eukprot:5085992-Amphidinium_carterae.1